MPAVKKGESRESYMGRCVPYVMKNEGKDNKAAVGKCEGMYDEHVKASRKSIPGQDIELTGEVEIMAEEKDASGATKEPTLYLHANTGKPMDLTGFEYPVVIDMKGAYFDKKATPVIVDHETSKRFGHTVEQVIIPAGGTHMLGGKAVKGPLVAALATRSSEMEIAKGITADAKKGFPFQTSVGAKIVKGYTLEEGDSAEVNGKTYHGPLVVASKTRIREISITVLGADNETSAVVVAKNKKEYGMDFTEWLKANGWDDPSSLDEKTKGNLNALYLKEIEAAEDTETEPEPPKKMAKGKKAKAKGKKGEDAEEEGDKHDKHASAAEGDLDIRAAEREERIEGIREVFENFKASGLETIEIKGKEMPLAKAKTFAIKEGWDVDKFELHCRRADLPNLASEGGRVAIHVNDGNVNAQALEVALLRASGVEAKGHNKKNNIDFGYETMYDAKALEESHKRQYQIGCSINRLFALQVQAAGGHISHLSDHNDLRAAAHAAWQKCSELRAKRLGTGTDIKASGFSTISVTNILENVMHKAAYTSFVMVEGIWPFITARRPVNDFKVHSLYRLDPNGHFRKVGPDGQLKHVSMTDTKKTLQAETYGAMITIDRKTQRNDDLQLIMDKARSIGSLGALRVEEAVLTLLLSNPSSFFGSGNSNLLTGAGSALSISSLTTAQQHFRDQLINGKPIAVSPSILLVGTNQEVLSNQLYNQAQMWVTTTADTPKFGNNPFVNRFTPHYTGYLNNTSITDQDGLTLSGQSTTQWYLFAPPTAPQGSALVIGFLDGRETPYFDEAATEFSVPGGIQMRAYFDFAVNMHIPQMALKSNGT